MLKLGDGNIVWAWVCPVTGTVLDEWWGRTEDYARDKTVRGWGKRRFEQGEMRPLRVRLEALSPEEAAKERAEFQEWKARKNAPPVAEPPKDRP
jgi:hypothetical protein